MASSVVAVDPTCNSPVPFLLATIDNPLNTIELLKEQVKICWLTLKHKKKNGTDCYFKSSQGVITARSIITEVKFKIIDSLVYIEPHEINHLLQITLLRSANVEMALTVSPVSILTKCDANGQTRYLVLFEGSTTWVPQSNVAQAQIEEFEKSNQSQTDQSLVTFVAPNLNILKEFSLNSERNIAQDNGCALLNNSIHTQPQLLENQAEQMTVSEQQTQTHTEEKLCVEFQTQQIPTELNDDIVEENIENKPKASGRKPAPKRTRNTKRKPKKKPNPPRRCKSKRARDLAKAKEKAEIEKLLKTPITFDSLKKSLKSFKEDIQKEENIWVRERFKNERELVVSVKRHIRRVRREWNKTGKELVELPPLAEKRRSSRKRKEEPAKEATISEPEKSNKADLEYNEKEEDDIQMIIQVNDFPVENNYEKVGEKNVLFSPPNTITRPGFSPSLIQYNSAQPPSLLTLLLIPPRIEKRSPQFIEHICNNLLEGKLITKEMTGEEVILAVKTALARLRFVFQNNTAHTHEGIRNILAAHTNANGIVPQRILAQALLFEQYDRKQQESDYLSIVDYFKQILMSRSNFMKRQTMSAPCLPTSNKANYDKTNTYSSPQSVDYLNNDNKPSMIHLGITDFGQQQAERFPFHSLHEIEERKETNNVQLPQDILQSYDRANSKHILLSQLKTTLTPKESPATQNISEYGRMRNHKQTQNSLSSLPPIQTQNQRLPQTQTQNQRRLMPTFSFQPLTHQPIDRAHSAASISTRSFPIIESVPPQNMAQRQMDNLMSYQSNYSQTHSFPDNLIFAPEQDYEIELPQNTQQQLQDGTINQYENDSIFRTDVNQFGSFFDNSDHFI